MSQFQSSPRARTVERATRAAAPFERAGAIALLFVASATLVACGGGSSCPTGVVSTTSGEVCGSVVAIEELSGTPVDAFLGIPFAESTAGDNRFAPPVPKARIDGLYDATSYGPACPQGSSNRPPEVTSEDCLSVNVWRPAGGATGRFP
jgi:hypothetical protein